MQLSDTNVKKKKQKQDSSIGEAKQGKLKRGKNKETPEERVKSEINKAVALQARFAKKKERPRKIKTVYDSTSNSNRKGKTMIFVFFFTSQLLVFYF